MFGLHKEEEEHIFLFLSVRKKDKPVGFFLVTINQEKNRNIDCRSKKKGSIICVISLCRQPPEKQKGGSLGFFGQDQERNFCGNDIHLKTDTKEIEIERSLVVHKVRK